MISPRPKTAILYTLFFLSGGAALGYQIAWARIFATGLGHEMPALLAIVCAFMGGMALGAATLDRVICRSRRPGHWYAWLEIAIAAWCCFSVVIIPLINEAALKLIGLDPSPLRHWAMAFSLPFLALLPATAAMGATLPAMERFVSPLVRDGRCLGALYAANTLGAVTGVLFSAFFIVPALGLSRSVCVLAQVNLLCGVVAMFLGARLSPVARGGYELARASLPKPSATFGTAAAADSRAPFSHTRLTLTVFVTGLLGLGYEVVGVRVLSQVLENTVYTFAAALAVFLVATSFGAVVYQKRWRGAHPQKLLSSLLGALSVACALGVFALSRTQEFYDACRDAFGDTVAGVLAAEMAASVAVFALPAFVMGATFSHLLQLSRRPEGGVGLAAAWNTLGGALAPALFGICLLPLVGAKWVLTLIVLGYVALQRMSIAGGRESSGLRRQAQRDPALACEQLVTAIAQGPSNVEPKRRRRFALPAQSKLPWWYWALPTSSLALLLVLPVNLELCQLPPGGRLAAYREGVMASVAVVEDVTGHRTLRVNNRFQMGGTAAAGKEYLQAHIPLLLHPGPKRALFLGTGTGITLGAATVHPHLHSDGVELVPEVVAVMPQFEPQNFGVGRASSRAGSSAASPHQATMRVADARRFVRATTNRYDVIVADLFHPARDGAGSLYTVEHFQAMRARLAPGGLVCQWLPLYQLDDDMLRVIARTFVEVFPHAQAWLLEMNVDTPVLGLIGALESRRYEGGWIERRLTSPALAAELKKLALADSLRFFGCFVAGGEALRKFAGDAPLNTDDQPRVTFGTPRFVYQRNVTSYGRLVKLLELGASDSPATPGFTPETEAFVASLKRYRQARDVYLHGLIADVGGEHARAIDAFVESARLSGDFTAGYAQCLTLASLQAKANPAEAKALLRRLVEAQPSRPVAREMLDRLEDR